MLKKMRWRLIFAAMLAFFAVIVLVAVLVNVVNYYNVTSRADETISYILGYEEGTPGAPNGDTPPMVPFMALPDVESNYMTRFFIVRFDPSGEVISTSTDYVASVDESDAAVYAQKELKRKADRGYIKVLCFLRSDPFKTRNR